MAPPVEYRLGLPEDARCRAAALYEEAFRQKFAPIVPRRDDLVAILAESIQPDRAIAALDGNGALLGLAGFHHAGRAFTSGGTASGVLRRLGLFRGIRAVALFALFERKPRPGELLMDGIAVASEARGRGVGTGLLERLFEHAAGLGCGRVRLDVIDTNPGARRLYERRGFVATRTSEHRWLERRFGFSATTEMIRELE